MNGRAVLVGLATVGVLLALWIALPFTWGSGDHDRAVFVTHPKLADDLYAWWMLIRTGEVPSGWAGQERRSEPMSVEALNCLGGEPTGRTGYAESQAFEKPPPLSSGSTESVSEDISVFDTPQHAASYLNSLAEQWQCTTRVINDDKASVDEYNYYGASISRTDALPSVPGSLEYTIIYSAFQTMQGGPRGRIRIDQVIEVHEDRVAELKDNVVYVVRHRLIGSDPPAAPTEQLVSAARGKIGLRPPPAETPVPPSPNPWAPPTHN